MNFETVSCSPVKVPTLTTANMGRGDLKLSRCLGKHFSKWSSAFIFPTLKHIIPSAAGAIKYQKLVKKVRQNFPAIFKKKSLMLIYVVIRS